MNWGILGSGSIARRFMTGVALVRDMRVVAVASRRQDSARKFAGEYGIENVEESCEALLKREDIDCVYVATPHTEHAALSIMAMKYGKAVLCEKPLTPNAAQVKQIIEAQKQYGVFMMEAMWMRFFPAFQKAREMIAAGEIGVVRAIEATFAFRTEDTDKNNRQLSPALAGGGLLDVGVYGLHFCQGMLNTWPVEKTGFCSMNTDEHQYGVDEQASLLMRFPDDVLATVRCAVKTTMPDHAAIYGTRGRIAFTRFWSPEGFTLTRADGEEQIIACPFENPPDGGFQYEIKHVQECIAKGLTQSPEMPLALSLKMAETCDDFREMWGLRYPFE